ncbi:hypothetical protein IFM89_028701 [Coptis chinensis]|uniref:Uncharacterized protein n=1 Tax=Coptis chinensis TaxID=261450 RepID=A0A835I7T0_9MAGN|nr:hypothetical protein IFM89_028701 [Coptis chinensis]
MYLLGLSLEKALAVIEADIIRPLVHLLQTAQFDIKKEAAWAISNSTSGGDNEQTKYLVSQGFIRPLCDLLVCPDPRIVTICLEGLENILKAEGLEKIEILQSHDNTDIYEKVVKILETYWLEDDEEATVDPPGGAAQPGFNFGGNVFLGSKVKWYFLLLKIYKVDDFFFTGRHMARTGLPGPFIVLRAGPQRLDNFPYLLVSLLARTQRSSDEEDVKAIAHLFADMGDSYVDLIATGQYKADFISRLEIDVEEVPRKSLALRLCPEPEVSHMAILLGATFRLAPT